MRKAEKVLIRKAEAVIHLFRIHPEANLAAQKAIDRAVNELEESIKKVKGET